jgi:type II secretory pathway component GspD/PulD (secretin)
VITRIIKGRSFFLTILLLAPIVSVCAQADLQKPEPAATPKTDKAPKPSFSVKVSTENILAISITAKDTKLSEIAADLSRKTKIPVALSPVMQKQVVTVSFNDMLLEPAMQLLAPYVYIDYRAESGPGTPPHPLGVFLYAHNEIPPATDAVVKAPDQSFVISGNTETNGDEPDEDDPIQIRYKNGKISVKAKDQPLIEVVSEMAEEAGIPYEAPETIKETVSVDIKDSAVDQALLSVSPDVRIFFRRDLYRAENTVLRIAVVDRKKSP